MEVKDNIIFKAEVIRKINRYINQFPIFFYGNIIVNIILLIIIGTVLFFVIIGAWLNPVLVYYGFVIVSFVSVILHITMNNFWKNYEILKDITAGRYNADVEDYELDNAIEFLEELPKSKEEVDQMRVALSFRKLIDFFEAADIITCENGVYDIDIIFRAQVEAAMEGRQREYL
jgi:hypothetical protein